MTWRPGTPRKALLRATAALKANPWRSDQMIARQARVSSTTAATARRQLEQAGLIPAVPVSRRERQPYPRQQSATHSAIIGGARTAREVADAAGTSYQAGWKALRAHRLREAIPVPPPPPAQCAACGRPYTPKPRRDGGRPQRYCSRSCAAAADSARRRIGPREVPVAVPPPVWEMPALPEVIWLGGLCVQPGAPLYWTSDDRQDREMARKTCRVCSVRVICRDWSLEALPRGDDMIYAGLDSNGRRRARYAALDESARRRYRYGNRK